MVFDSDKAKILTNLAAESIEFSADEVFIVDIYE